MLEIKPEIMYSDSAILRKCKRILFFAFKEGLHSPFVGNEPWRLKNSRIERRNEMDVQPCLIGIGAVLIMIGMYLSKETTYAKYSGTTLIGFEDRPRFKNNGVRTTGCILLLVGILTCIIAMAVIR